MITTASILSFDKDDLMEASKTLCADEILQLVGWVSEKDDTLRYHSFLLLQHRSEYYNDVYPYWDIFCEKLKNMNSYQRSIGLMLIAANIKWDTDNKIDNIIDEYLSLLHDEKPITVRQCIQSLRGIVQYKNHLNIKIAEKLMALNICEIKTTMQKLVLIDILTILALIRRKLTNSEIDNYIFNALSGGMMDKKAITQIEAMLR